jgi:hypothetical protein
MWANQPMSDVRPTETNNLYHFFGINKCKDEEDGSLDQPMVKQALLLVCECE